MNQQNTNSPRHVRMTSITIENFKGIGLSVTIPLRPITLLFGANSAGKSTIIQALHYARELLERDNPDAGVPVAGGNAIDFGGFRNLVHKHDLTSNIRIGFEVSLGEAGLPELDEIIGKELDFKYDWWQALEHKRLSDVCLTNMEKALKEGDNEAMQAELLRFQRYTSSQAPIKPQPANIGASANSISIQMSAVWNNDTQRPWLREMQYGLNGDSFMTIIQDNPDSDAYIGEISALHPTINAYFSDFLASPDIKADDSRSEEILEMQLCEPPHPYKTSECTAGARVFREFIAKRSDAKGRIVLKGQKRAVPHLNMPLPLGVNFNRQDKDELGYDIWIAKAINQIILGTTYLLKNQLNEFRYIGPIRVKPDRDHRAPSIPDESRWADGSAAWDLLLKHCEPQTDPGQNFIQHVSEWMSEESKLDLGYSLSVGISRFLPEASSLWKYLQFSYQQTYDKGEDIGKNIRDELDKLPIKTQLGFIDLKNQVPVGPADIGMGIIQSVPVIVAALDPNKKILAVEQPELHLHPKVACNLGDLFLDQINNGKIFIIETHSEHLILRIKRRMRQKKLKPDDVMVLFILPGSNGGYTRSIPLRMDDDGAFIDEWPGGFFEEGFDELFGKD